MKKTYIKNILRSVKGSFSRFIAIFAITALGVGFLAGLLSTTPDMRSTIDHYYDDYRMMDIYMKSTYGFNEDDIAAVRETEGVETVMPHYVMDTLADTGSGSALVARIYGYDYDNMPLAQMKLVEGRYPENAGEILAEEGNGMFVSLELGETITLLAEEDEELSDTYTETKLTVVGIVNNPYYMSVERESSSKGNGRVGVMVYGREELFALDVYTDLFVSASGALELDTFSDEYETLIERVTDSLEGTADIRIVQRFDEIVAEANAEIDDAEAEYLEKRADAEKELADAAAELADAEKELSDGRQEIANKRAEIADGRARIAQARTDLNNQYAQLEASKAMLPAQMYEQSKAQLDAAAEQLTGQETILTDSEAKLDEAEREITDGEAELADGKAEYLEKKAEAEAEFADAEREIADARADVEALEKPEWYVLDREATVSYVSFDSNADKIAAIAKVFPVFFFLVAALVALTTMTRMIEEERGQIGVLKALGYSRGAIMMKYILYAGVSGLLGSAVGLVIGLYIFPSIVWGAYGIMYTFPPIEINFIPSIALPSAGALILCTLGATVWAGSHILTEKPAQLLLPRAPKAGKRVLLERITPLWKRFSFNQKVTCRNLFRYKKRFFMTVIGIAGCTALLVTGFGLRDSISDIVALQYNELMQYNLSVSISDEEPDELTAYLNNPAKVSDYTSVHSEYGKIHVDGETLNVNFIVPRQAEGFTDFMVLRDRTSGMPIVFDEDAVVLSEKMASLLGVEAGETVELENEDGETASFTVSGITENYVQSYAYIPASLYTANYDTEPEFATYYIKSTAADHTAEDVEITALLAMDGISSVAYSTSMSESFDNMLGKIDYIVIVLIICAGLLAFVVLYNLTNINIAEREKELGTIKVLGYYDSEVAAYVYRETAALSVIGTLVGLVLGIFLHRFVVLTAEMDTIMFGRIIYAPSFLLSAAITLLFSALVCLVMVKRLKGIDMVESMKGGE